MAATAATLLSVAVIPSATSTALTSALGVGALSVGCRGCRGWDAGFDGTASRARVDG